MLVIPKRAQNSTRGLTKRIIKNDEKKKKNIIEKNNKWTEKTFCLSERCPNILNFIST